MDEWLESGRVGLWRDEIKKYKIRNNARRDKDNPALREAGDDIYLLLGLLETATTERVKSPEEIAHEDSYWDDPLRGTNKC